MLGKNFFISCSSFSILSSLVRNNFLEKQIVYRSERFCSAIYKKPFTFPGRKATYVSSFESLSRGFILMIKRSFLDGRLE